MRLENLRLLHFRNYSQVSLPLAHDITIFYGDNAQGKTNLLEGIYTAARGFSFRTRHEEELPSFGAEEWAAELQYRDRYGSNRLLVKRYPVRGRTKKENLLNGNPVRGSYRTTRAVNIKLDILRRIFCFQEEKLRNDQVRTNIVYLFSKENDSVLKKS